MLKARGLTLKSALKGEVQPLYEFWRDNWGREFKEQSLNGIDTQTSDDFRNSDLIRSIWAGDSIVAMMLVSRFDLSLEWDRASSYFTGWPPEFFEVYRNQPVRALRYFIVAPEFRRNPTFKSAAMMLAICLKDFIASNDEALIGMTLKRFGAHTLTHKFGLERHGADGQLKHGVPVEYASVSRANVNRDLVRSLTDVVIDEFDERRSEDLSGLVADEKGRRVAG